MRQFKDRIGGLCMQKNGKKLLAWMLAASMVFSFSMPTQAAKKKPALSKKKAVITVGKTLTLKVKNISKKTKVTWKSKKKKKIMRIKHNFVFFFSFYQKGIYYEKD